MLFIRIIFFLLIPLFSYSQYEILGLNNLDGSVSVPAAADPSALTWTKVHEERYLTTIDESFIHYTSNFASSTSTLSAASGSAPAISGGNLTITGSCIYQSTSNPTASWYAAEMTIASMTSVGDSQKLGPSVVNDASNYIAGIYEKVNGKLQIIQNGTIILNVSASLNTTGLKLWLVAYGNFLALWYKESAGSITLGGTVDNLYDFKVTGTAVSYQYGVYCLQSGSTTTHNINSLRGGASGGVGIFNNRTVKNEDGSDYILAGKLLMTGDLSPASLGLVAYTGANSCLFSLDTATWAVEIVGRFYFDRSGKRLGGQDIKLLWESSQNRWIMSYVPVDNSGALDENDYYIFLNYADVFEEHIISSVDMTVLGFGAANKYDANIRKIDGVYKVVVTAGFGTGRLQLYSGTSLSSLTQVAAFDNGVFYELGTFARFNNTWYIHGSTFGDTKEIVLTYPGLALVGYLNLPFVYDAYIPGYDWFVKQANGYSQYYLVGFDTDLYTVGATEYYWSLGRLVIWKANQQSTGYEF